MVLPTALGVLFVQRATRDGRINLHRIMVARGYGLLPSQACRQLARCRAVLWSHA